MHPHLICTRFTTKDILQSKDLLLYFVNVLGLQTHTANKQDPASLKTGSQAQGLLFHTISMKKLLMYQSNV